MSQIREQAIERMRRDHDGLLDLIGRIKATCTEGDAVDNCNQCRSSRPQVCHAEIRQLLGAFVEATLKHNVLESLYMEALVPKAHRQAHNQAHLAIADQVKAIRIVLAEDGNCVLAIAGIGDVLRALTAHLTDYDQQLEGYLLAT